MLTFPPGGAVAEAPFRLADTLRLNRRPVVDPLPVLGPVFVAIAGRTSGTHSFYPKQRFALNPLTFSGQPNFRIAGHTPRT